MGRGSIDIGGAWRAESEEERSGGHWMEVLHLPRIREKLIPDKCEGNHPFFNKPGELLCLLFFSRMEDFVNLVSKQVVAHHKPRTIRQADR